MNTLITDEELEVLAKTSDILNSFTELPSMHPNDLSDFRFHINALQNIILARAGQRVYNEQTETIASWERKYQMLNVAVDSLT